MRLVFPTQLPPIKTASPILIGLAFVASFLTQFTAYGLIRGNSAGGTFMLGYPVSFISIDQCFMAPCAHHLSWERYIINTLIWLVILVGAYSLYQKINKE